MLADELAPRSLAATWRWLNSVSQEDLTYGDMRAPMAQVEQLAFDPSVTPPRVLSREPDDQIVAFGAAAARPARALTIGRPLAPHQLTMPAQKGLRAR